MLYDFIIASIEKLEILTAKPNFEKTFSTVVKIAVFVSILCHLYPFQLLLDVDPRMGDEAIEVLMLFHEVRDGSEHKLSKA